MSDLPPRFTADLEDSLPGGSGSNHRPSLTSRPTGNTTGSSSTTPRQWDDPPDDDAPPGPSENPTTMVFLHSATIALLLDSEVLHLTFTLSDSHLAALVPRCPSTRNFRPDDPCEVMAFSAATYQRALIQPTNCRDRIITAAGGFAFRPATADMLLACPVWQWQYGGGGGGGGGANQGGSGPQSGMVPRVEVFDLGRKERRVKEIVAMQAPVAWSADGRFLVGVSTRDKRRVVVCEVLDQGGGGGSTSGRKDGKEWGVRVSRVVFGHTGEVTQVGFLPVWEEGGMAMVTAGMDGYVRVASIASGRTLKKIAFAARAAPASILRVSPDGKLVVTVWGSDVVLWYLQDGRVCTYNLDAVRRQGEGWPLTVSPCCRYLACRTEDGFDVSDVVTGKFRGEFALKRPPITAAAFNSDGNRIAIGDYGGQIRMYEILTGTQ